MFQSQLDFYIQTLLLRKILIIRLKIEFDVLCGTYLKFMITLKPKVSYWSL